MQIVRRCALVQCSPFTYMAMLLEQKNPKAHFSSYTFGSLLVFALSQKLSNSFFCMKIRKWSKNSKMRKSRLPSHGSMKTRLVDTKICIIIVPYGFIELKADWTECQYYGEEGKLLLWRPWPHCLSEVPEPIQQGIIVVRRLDIFFTFLASVKHK